MVFAVHHFLGELRACRLAPAGVLMTFALSSWGVVAFGQAEAPPTQDSGIEQLQEVVVTAEKRAETIQSAPVAVTVLNMDSLASANVGDISGLNNLVPALQINEGVTGRAIFGVRGISSTANSQSAGLSSGVEVAVDGVPIPWDSSAANQLEDVSSVEVLEGPQSTLGGRTASAGEINIVTHNPSNVLTGSVSATATNDHEKHLQLYLAGPISDDLTASLFAYGHGTQLPIENLYNGDYTHTEDEGLRGKLRWQPTANLDITLAAHYQLYEAIGDSYVYSYVVPGSCLYVGTPPCSAHFPTAESTVLPGITPNSDNQKLYSPIQNPGAVAHDYDTTLTVNYDFGDGYTLSSTSNFQHENQYNVQDVFDTTFAFNALTHSSVDNDQQTQNYDISQKSEELKLLSPKDQTVSYIAGFFYSDSTVNVFETRSLPPAAVNLTATPETATYDVYGRATWTVAPDAKLIGGIRYNYDDISYRLWQTAFLGSIPNECAFCASNGSHTSSVVLGDLTLQQEVADHSTAYGKYSRGYAPGAYNVIAGLSCADSATYAGKYPEACPGTGKFTQAAPLALVPQEDINSFEIGSKGIYFDRRLSLNADIFYTLYKNYQIQTNANETGVLDPPKVLSSAGAAETKGIEVNSVLAAGERTTVGVNAAVVRAIFTKYPEAPCWGYGTTAPAGQTASQGCVVSPSGIGTQNVEGHPLPNSPKFKAALDAAHTIPLNVLPLDLVVGGNYHYQTRVQMQADQNPETAQGGFGILDLNAALTSKDKRYKVTAFLNNVSDHHYFSDMEDFFSSAWKGNAVIGEPARDATRYGGLRFDASF